MATVQYKHPDLFDYGLDRLKTATTSIALVDYNYVAGDSYATVRGAADVNIIAEKTGVVDADIVLSTYGNGRKATVASFTVTPVKTSGGVTDRLRFAALDTVNSKVLEVWQETSSQIVTIGMDITFPELTDTSILVAP